MRERVNQEGKTVRLGVCVCVCVCVCVVQIFVEKNIIIFGYFLLLLGYIL